MARIFPLMVQYLVSTLHSALVTGFIGKFLPARSCQSTIPMANVVSVINRISFSKLQ